MSRVTIIPAKLDRATFMPLDKPKKRRVAGYARVSTDCPLPGKIDTKKHTKVE